MQNILTHFPELTATQQAQLTQLQPLYASWNEQINVISRKDIEHLYDHHILHSMAMAKIVEWQAGTQVLDVGTGGGLPGIPLAILFPQVEFLLVDSIGKKVKVADAIAQSIGLTNVKTQHARAETLPRASFDFVVARAVTALPTLWEWSKGLLKPTHRNSLPNGLLTYKGNDAVLAADITQLPPKVSHRIFPIADFWKEAYYETKCIVWVGKGGKYPEK